jgi:hypothetical protein
MAPQVLFRVIYGTSRPEPWQQKQITIRPAVLHKFIRQRVRHADFPAIVPVQDPSKTVRGAFISGLTDIDVLRLDHFEGYMYERQKVKVRLLKNVRLEDDVPDSDLGRVEGEELEAETYVWTEDLEGLEDQDWDFKHFREQKMKAWMGEPDLTTAPGTEVDEGFADADAAGPAQARISASSHRGAAGQGARNRGTAGRGRSARGAADPGRAGRSAADRVTSAQGAAGRGAAGRCIAGRGMSGHETAGRCTSGKGNAGPGTSDHGTAGQGTRSTM